MTNEKNRNKKKREQRKIERLKLLLGIDLCACGGGHQLQCCGICRKFHTDSNTGKVECQEMYQIDRSIVKSGDFRRPKRTWNYGRQKEESDNKGDKQQRREKRKRDQLNS